MVRRRLYEIRRKKGGKRQQEGAREVELRGGRPRQSRPRTRRRVEGGKMTTGPMRRILTKEEKVQGARQEKEEKGALLEKLRGNGSLNDCPDEVFGELAEQLVEQLDRRYREVARERFQSSLASSLQNKRRSHTELGDRVNSLLTTIRLGEKAISEFAIDDTRAALSRHLLKEAGVEMVNEMFLYVAEENMLKIEEV